MTQTTLTDDLALLWRLFPPHARPTAIGTVVADDKLHTVTPLRQRGWITTHESTWVSGGKIAALTSEGRKRLRGWREGR